MKENRKFLRQCIVCKKYKKKEELIRLTKDYNTKKIFINTDNSYIGYSYYVCKTKECVEKLRKNKKITASAGEIIKDISDTVLKK